MNKNKGFTLIELLVVIAIISLLASVVLASLDAARAQARDAQRRAELKQLATANELYFNDEDMYLVTDGWIEPEEGDYQTVDRFLVPDYISILPTDPLNSGYFRYQYWRRDRTLSECPGAPSGTIKEYGFYARLENPTAEDLATIEDEYDECVQDIWRMNYKVGN